MKPTKALNLVALAAVVSIAGFVLATTLVARGLPVPISPNTLLVTLTAISAVLLLLAIPIWRYRDQLKKTSKTRPKRVDPFYAVRVLLLAKASSIAGAIFIGWHSGVLVYQLISAVIVQNLVIKTILGILASVALTASAIAAEQICRLPQDPTPDSDQAVTN